MSAKMRTIVDLEIAVGTVAFVGLMILWAAGVLHQSYQAGTAVGFAAGFLAAGFLGTLGR